MLECLVVGAGGFIGSVCRYLIGLIPLKEGTIFPIKTMIINIVGAFIIGFIAALALKNNAVNPRLILFIKAGICGGFTTFSSFALETGDLIKSGHMGIALVYGLLSLILGVLAVFAGEAAGQAV
ncbi:MAG TPA: fluoride efflux transporter CrcB [Candidatus Scybalocola faecigallinarum]|uniref:Fluoride-specific ion channel FluC n=1 Tax=Candidatus Scybalocola faecigallinarum TaxID=2840941 RepID=A0A9D1F5Z9_9FIRM|nr:fluoride efflux transporter CrcB [Candidatus Scybalocola faecigallinarum]